MAGRSTIDRPRTLTEKLIADHVVDGEMSEGTQIALRMDQTLTQDATGTMVMLELEALGLDRVKTDLSVQYVDHNLLQTDEKNADDHVFLESACRRFGIWYSRPGNGVSHPVHMQRFGVPGATLIGSDSHTPAAGSLGMLAFGGGGLDVAMSMAGHPLRITMPKIFGIEVTGALPDWVSAKDVILELLRRHDVDGAKGFILEYFGSGLGALSAMDRHVIANMGTELGATSSVFPSDAATRDFLVAQGRENDWQALHADDGAAYDRMDAIDLNELEPLIAKPSSPGNVVPVREVAGEPIYQAYIGSSANPGYRDFAIVSAMVSGQRVPETVSLDINPTSRQLLDRMARDGTLEPLAAAGARLHQAGCNGCIGMGQAPASGRNSLRTVPRNFPGRSGAREDSVFLCSPETAAASALAGTIADPREMAMAYPRIDGADVSNSADALLDRPPPAGEARQVKLVKSDNIESLPEFDALPDCLEIPVLLALGDHVSTDEILPAGSRALPYRSNIPRISDFAFDQIDSAYPAWARDVLDKDGQGHAIVAGRNYGQGSSREHAVIATRFLGLRVVLAKSIARIHHQNLANFGVLPLTVDSQEDFDRLSNAGHIAIDGIHQTLDKGQETISVGIDDGYDVDARIALDGRQRELVRAGGLINHAAAS